MSKVVTALEFLAYMVENYNTGIYCGRLMETITIGDDHALAMAIREFELTDDVAIEINQHKGEENESGYIYVKIEDVKFGVFYHDQEEKAKFVHDFNI